MKVLITGGAGFIGSAVIRRLIHKTDYQVLNVDSLTYASSLASLSSVDASPRYSFVKADICDAGEMMRVFLEFGPDRVIHLAAETHVDRSIDDPSSFIETNVKGTFVLLEVARSYWRSLDLETKGKFRFLHVSTDEVFGDLGLEDPKFCESTSYAPSSPYSASKAASDHLVAAWHRTYGLPTLMTNCSNNYGPFQFPEKLIPLMVQNALNGKPLPVYGLGQQIRDWLYVDDHADAILCVLEKGRLGRSYNIGGECEIPNIQMVEKICLILERLAPNRPQGVGAYRDLISFVKDRPGHDSRYAIDISRIRTELGWEPTETLESGLEKTVAWYLANKDWSDRIQKDRYNGRRLGLSSGAGN